MREISSTLRRQNIPFWLLRGHAEAEIPKAMAEAFRSGNLGVMDYYNLRNIEADTDMRMAIGGGPAGETPSQS